MIYYKNMEYIIYYKECGVHYFLLKMWSKWFTIKNMEYIIYYRKCSVNDLL